jgi:hypothetical protein
LLWIPSSRAKGKFADANGHIEVHPLPCTVAVWFTKIPHHQCL